MFLINSVKMVVILVEFRLRVGHARITNRNSVGFFRFVGCCRLNAQNKETKSGL